MTHGASMSVHLWERMMDALISAMKRCQPPLSLVMLCSVWALSFLSPLNGNLNIDFCFLFKKHKLHFKKKIKNQLT